jgi:hypothetical protein
MNNSTLVRLLNHHLVKISVQGKPMILSEAAKGQLTLLELNKCPKDYQNKIINRVALELALMPRHVDIYSPVYYLSWYELKIALIIAKGDVCPSLERVCLLSFHI